MGIGSLLFVRFDILESFIIISFVASKNYEGDKVSKKSVER